MRSHSFVFKKIREVPNTTFMPKRILYMQAACQFINLRFVNVGQGN